MLGFSQFCFHDFPAGEFCTDCPYAMMQSHFDDLPTLAFATDCIKRGERLNLPICEPDLRIDMRFVSTGNST